MSTHDDDTDPTGMRALLRGLPDPGPMPPDLVERIHASLAELPPVTAADRHLDEPHGPAHGGASRSWWSRHGPKTAVAAVVLLGGGALAAGPLGLLGGASVGGADSASVEAAKTDDGSQFRTDSDSGADSAGGSADLARSAEAGPITVRMSGRDYRGESLAQDAPVPAAGPTTTPLTAESPSIGPIGTEIGVRSCLEALGLPRATGADVDLATVDGSPAAVIVVTTRGGRTAYAVGRDCTIGNPALILGPVSTP